MKKSRIDFYGSSELLKKLEKAGANVEKVVVNALEKSIQKPKAEMLEYIRQHKMTGQTEESFKTEIKQEGDKIYLNLGFDIKHGGLAAVFLNYGTPKIAPSFFVDNAIENNIDEIKRVQLEALNEAFKGLK